jgi:Tol biopolymer transport system component
MEYSISKFIFTILLATDISGNYQICFTSNNSNPDFSGIKPVTFLNSPYDDLYPALNSEKSRIFFCSNREGGQFDIYYTEIPNVTANLESILSDTAQHQIFKDTIISSGSDDKCPFVYQNTLIFASNRAGGFGGYDLYYCTLENGNWSKPVNFGETINSGYDEYRPILLESGVTETEKMMIFSSNRPGGKGGYDLYFVGVKF